MGPTGQALIGSAIRYCPRASVDTAALCGRSPVKTVTKYPFSITSMWGLKHALGWQYCEVLAAVIRERKSTFSCAFLVHPMGIHTSASAQNVCRAGSMILRNGKHPETCYNNAHNSVPA
jgi:hypothetical protein